MISIAQGEGDDEQLSLLISYRASFRHLAQQFECKFSINYLAHLREGPPEYRPTWLEKNFFFWI